MIQQGAFETVVLFSRPKRLLQSLCHPVLWKSYNQIPLALKVRFPRDSQTLCQIPRLRSLTRGSEPSQQWENFFASIVLQFVACPPARYGIWSYLIAPLLSSHCCFFVFRCAVFFFWFCFVLFFLVGSNFLLLIVVQQLVAILVALTEDECMFFYSIISNQNHKREVNLLREKWGLGQIFSKFSSRLWEGFIGTFFPLLFPPVLQLYPGTQARAQPKSKRWIC